MWNVATCVATEHNLALVVMAALVCIGGGKVALELYGRAAERSGVQKSGWIFLAAVAAGSSVWCTHFIAMLAFESAAPTTYDPVLTFVSLLVVIAGSALSFKLGLTDRLTDRIAGGVLLGFSIASMHYIGMVAYRIDGIVEWNVAYVVASFLVAIGFGAFVLALSLARRGMLSLLMFVVAVVGLHFTGMTALHIAPLVTGAPLVDATVTAGMGVAVAGVALLIVATGVASYVIDSDASSQSLDALRQMAMNDALTGLPNRTSYGLHLGHALLRAQATGSKVAVIGIDLDNFKEINDIRGHDAGDEALRIIGERLSGSLKDGEFVARMGGDEFAAAKVFTEQRLLLEFVSRLEAELFLPLRVDDFEIVPGASIGISVYPADGDNAARLISNADLAMYRAKADVTRASCFYEAAMDEAARVRRDLALDLRMAIENGQLELHYQVQTSVDDARDVVGYEVLLRWKHPRLGHVPPADFIPLAEQTGTILTIGEWVLREACREAARWPEEEKIAVNLSPVQLTHSDMPRIVHTILLETGLAASRLELEVTESTIMQDKARSLHALRQIRALGVTIAIDDFGTGYSSLDTLRSFPFDRIKLDRSFMNEVEESGEARAIIRAVLALGKSLGINVLAEGVETEAQLQLLQREGCDEVQGYLLGRPGPRRLPAPAARVDAA